MLVVLLTDERVDSPDETDTPEAAEITDEEDDERLLTSFILSSLSELDSTAAILARVTVTVTVSGFEVNVSIMTDSEAIEVSMIGLGSTSLCSIKTGWLGCVTSIGLIGLETSVHTPSSSLCSVSSIKSTTSTISVSMK